MIKSGLKPNKISHKDYDYGKNREALFGATKIPEFPAFYNADQLGWIPNQNIIEDAPIPHPAQPYGCTNFTQASLSNNLIQQVIRRPSELENLTQANEKGGSDLRTSLDAARKVLGWFDAFYAVRSSSLDMFDTIRLALIEGADEHRTVSVGTPWYRSFEMVGEDGMINELAGSYTWHNWQISGWLTVQGVPKLIGKSWQGKNYGDKGLCYFTREQINQLFAVNGSCAYVPSARVTSPARIDTSWLQYVLSILRQYGKSLLPFSY